MDCPKKILVVRGGAIGDFILTLPVFQVLKASFPSAQIGCLSQTATGELARMSGLTDEVHNLDDGCWASFFVENGELDSSASEWLASFDCIVSFLHDERGVWKGNVLRVSEATFHRGSSQLEERGDQNASVTLLEALKPIGIMKTDPVPRIRITDPPIKTNTIALHPGSGSKLKNWPEQKWSQLISMLLEDGQSLLLVGGEAEADKLERLASTFPNTRLRKMLNEPLIAVAREVEACRWFVGHDSGITHLASALGLPCIVLWAQTNETVWCPQGKRVHVLKNLNGIKNIEPRDVFDFFKKVSSIH